MDVKTINRDINDLAESFIPYVRYLLGFEYNDWKVFLVEGYRTRERQQYLYDQGRKIAGIIRTHAKPGQSMHNYGFAVDVAFQHTEHQIVSYDKNLYKKLYEYVKHIGIEWGGNWTFFRDYGHFQITNSKQLSMYKTITDNGTELYALINGVACHIVNSHTMQKGVALQMWNGWQEIVKVTTEELKRLKQGGVEIAFLVQDE